MDINSFSVYLAGINLFVQILDDVHRLIKSGKEIPLISFKLQVGNTFRLFGELKEERFHYVVSNPPYVNAKRADFSPPSELLEEFSGRLRGDVNTYALFLCIASEILHEGGRLAYIVPLTLLGDQQTERLRRFFSERGTVLHLTKFHRRTNVLFEGVTQAVVVFVWEKGQEQKTLPTVSWGGVKAETREEIVREALTNTVSVESVVYKIEKPPENSQEDMFGERDYTVWVVLSGKDTRHTKELYRAFNTIISHEKTLKDLLQEFGIDPEEDFKQGDVNTTHVAPYHVEKDTPRAMPIYKGEDLRPFSTLSEEPAGVKGRDGSCRPPYVAPREEDQTGVNETLWRIYKLEEEEWLIAINRIVVSLNHPRNIRGSIAYRNRSAKKVFTDKVWVLRCQNKEISIKIASLMFSLPFVFQNNALNTNTQVNKNTLLLLKVPPEIPDRVIDHYSNLEKLSQEFRSLGIEDITEHLNPLWYELKENLSFEKLVPWKVLLSSIPAITLEDFLLRYADKLREPRGAKINSYLKEEYWKFHKKEAEIVIQLFRENWGEERYEAIKDKPLLPDNPIAFSKRLDNLKKRFNILLYEWKDNLKAIDIAILEGYGLTIEPEKLAMPLIK